MQIGGGQQLHPRSKEARWNMAINVRSMIRYAVHTLYQSNHVKYFRDKILIGKAKAKGNNYQAQMEHVAKMI